MAVNLKVTLAVAVNLKVTLAVNLKVTLAVAVNMKVPCSWLMGGKLELDTSSENMNIISGFTLASQRSFLRKTKEWYDNIIRTQYDRTI